MIKFPFKKRPYKKTWFYILFTKPDLYLYKLIANTLVVGLVVLILSFLYLHSNFRDIRIPTIMHSLIGIAIGFLLVFRANSSYERWYDGKKSLSIIQKNINLFILKLSSCTTHTGSKIIIKEKLKSYLYAFQKHVKDNNNEVDEAIKEEQNRIIYDLLTELKKCEQSKTISDKDVSSLENYFSNIIDKIGVCERIKDTPIPISFSLHIKVSIFIYIFTLPFGLFYDLKLWSTLMVMIIFYIIYGIELISEEIENPFRNDPNDIPIDDFTLKNIKFIDNNIKYEKNNN